MKMGGGTGTRRQRNQDFLQKVGIPITENSADLAQYFPENGGIIPRTQKWGDAFPRPPPPPVAESLAVYRQCRLHLSGLNARARSSVRYNNLLPHQAVGTAEMDMVIGHNPVSMLQDTGY